MKKSDYEAITYSPKHLHMNIFGFVCVYEYRNSLFSYIVFRTLFLNSVKFTKSPLDKIIIS